MRRPKKFKENLGRDWAMIGPQSHNAPRRPRPHRDGRATAGRPHARMPTAAAFRRDQQSGALATLVCHSGFE